MAFDTGWFEAVISTLCNMLMGWLARLRERRELKRLADEDRAERLTARLQARREVDQVGSIASAADALGKALANTFQMQSQLLASTGTFLAAMQDLSAKKAAQVMGSRGGKARAANKKKLAPPPECPLCINPHTRAVTWEMIQEHRKHEAASNPGSSETAEHSRQAMNGNG